MVRRLAASGARVQLALAPAGSGKTVTLRTLADAWAAGGSTVIGLAPTAAAARVLREELGDSVTATDTLAKLVHALTTGTAVPDWVAAIQPGRLVIVDEAGMASTLELAAVVDYAVAHGASVRLVGDDRQLAAVGAGGVLRDIDRTHGAVTLSEVCRFTHADGSTNRAEAAASLAIRRGDPAGLAYYLDHGRIPVGDDTTTADQAFAAWSTDRAAGLDALLIASTNELVRGLNLRAQAARLAATEVPAKRRVTLADGTTVSDGDAIITRRNDRRLTLSATDWVANGDRWSVTSVRADGALEVRHAHSRRRVTLLADYVAQHVQLGYACTVHAAQGETVDTSHTVLTGTESRQLLYVALTRGRHATHLYLDVSVSGDDDDAILHADAIRPPTATELLTRVVEHDDSAVSATSTRREERDPDVRPTGPPANDRAGGYVQQRLDRRVGQAGGLQTSREPARLGSPKRSIQASPAIRSGRPSPGRSPRPTKLASTAPSCDASLPAGRCRSKRPPPPWRTASSTRSATGQLPLPTSCRNPRYHDATTPRRCRTRRITPDWTALGQRAGLVPAMTRRSQGRQRAKLLAWAPQASHVLGRGRYALPHSLERPAEPGPIGANRYATRGASSGSIVPDLFWIAPWARRCNPVFRRHRPSHAARATSPDEHPSLELPPEPSPAQGPWHRYLLYWATGAEVAPARGGTDALRTRRRRESARACRRSPPAAGPTRSAAMTTIETGALAVNGAEKLLTVDALCEYLAVSKDFIYDEVRHGRLRASRIARQLRFRPADVDAFVEANAVTDSDL